jgi:hypothetical protein
MIDFWYLTPLSAIFQQCHATSFSDGRSQSTQREQPTMGNQLVNSAELIEQVNISISQMAKGARVAQ